MYQVELYLAGKAVLFQASKAAFKGDILGKYNYALGSFGPLPVLTVFTTFYLIGNSLCYITYICFFIMN